MEPQKLCGCKRIKFRYGFYDASFDPKTNLQENENEREKNKYTDTFTRIGFDYNFFSHHIFF